MNCQPGPVRGVVFLVAWIFEMIRPPLTVQAIVNHFLNLTKLGFRTSDGDGFLGIPPIGDSHEERLMFITWHELESDALTYAPSCTFPGYRWLPTKEIVSMASKPPAFHFRALRVDRDVVRADTAETASFAEPQKFQLFCAGLDGVYGTSSSQDRVISQGPVPDEEKDNITNFSGGGTLEDQVE